jgi:hypothetical protein
LRFLCEGRISICSPSLRIFDSTIVWALSANHSRFDEKHTKFEAGTSELCLRHAARECRPVSRRRHARRSLSLAVDEHTKDEVKPRGQIMRLEDFY